MIHHVCFKCALSAVKVAASIRATHASCSIVRKSLINILDRLAEGEKVSKVASELGYWQFYNDRCIKEQVESSILRLIDGESFCTFERKKAPCGQWKDRRGCVSIVFLKRIQGAYTLRELFHQQLHGINSSAFFQGSTGWLAVAVLSTINTETLLPNSAIQA